MLLPLLLILLVTLVRCQLLFQQLLQPLLLPTVQVLNGIVQKGLGVLWEYADVAVHHLRKVCPDVIEGNHVRHGLAIFGTEDASGRWGLIVGSA